MADPFQVGWCLTAEEAVIAYGAPARFVPPKDRSREGRGFLSCPAVRGYFDGIFAVTAPFSLRLRLSRGPDGARIQPVYPFSSLSEVKFRQFVTVEPADTQRDPSLIVMQFPSPYLFFADTPVVVEQFSPSFANAVGTNWRVVPGKFDIYSWQRPLNWAVEWDSSLGDFVVRAGDIQYFIRFSNLTSGGHHCELIECEMTRELQERLRLSQGITGMRKGTVPLMKRAGSLRADMSLIRPK